jgi:hypothetical protein
VADLTVTAGFPCISVLLPTLPAPRMVRADRDRLLGLAVSRSFVLPLAVEPRALVERTFATRPLVAALHRFCALSRHLERLAGRIDTHDQPTALDLALAGAEAVEAYLRTRRQDALRQLEEALHDRPGDVATGIAACRHAVRSRRPAMLLVEENFISPGEVGSSSPSGAVEVHDEVDDLMEQVILGGGQLALVRDGDLEAWDRVALISRR